MPRLLGVDIPNDKAASISLTYLYGVGPAISRELCHKAGIDASQKARDLTEDELEAVKDWRQAECFDAADRAVLAATDDTLSDGCISADTWAECAAALKTEEELLELTGAIGAWRVISQIARSIELQLEDGVASWPPNGQAPA